MLDKGHLLWFEYLWRLSQPRERIICVPHKLAFFPDRYVPQEFIRKIFVQHHEAGPQVRRHTSQSETVLPGIHLKIRIRENCGDCA